MRNGKRVAAWSMVAVTCLGLMALPGCGGGGGGDENELPAFAALSGGVYFGVSQGGSETLSRFPTLPSNPTSSMPPIPVPPGGSVSVPGAEFPSSAVGQQDFIQLTFNIPLDAATIFPGGGAAADGIVVYGNQQDPGTGATTSVPVPFSLDATGAVDPGNAFPSAGVAPAVLRIYYDSDSDLSTAEAMPPGSYSLRINQTLKAFNGGDFCTNPAAGCGANTYLPELSFVVGTESTNLSVKGSPTGIGASNVIQGATAVPINTEVELRFNKAVAFETLVDAANLSTLDPFITQPFAFVDPGVGGPPWNCQAAGAGTNVFGLDIGNLYVGYNAPIDPVTGLADPPPPGLGVVVYMPDPILNPTVVRIRMVDASGTPVGTTPGAGAQLNGVDDPTGANTGTTQYQNYASNPSKLPILSNDPNRSGVTLSLPAARVVPGSLPGYNPVMGLADPLVASFDVVVAAAMSGDPTGNGCSMPLGNPLVDRVSATFGGPNQFNFNMMSADYFLRFAWDAGPPLARNPSPPDATFVGSTIGNLKGLACINTAATMSDLAGPGTNTQAPPWAGASALGSISLSPNRLADQGVLGTPVDMAVGHWILTQQLQATAATNNIANPGRAPTTTPGVPDTQNGTTPAGLLELLGLQMPPFPPVQPWGNFLYVADGDTNSVKVFNGYDFQLISSITGAGSMPSGLAISPDLEFLYVSDYLGQTVRRFYANPVGANFHSLANTIPLTGSGPRAISVQPANEDVFVCNYGDNSFSVLEPGAGIERSRFADSAAVGPEDVFITTRMLGPGLPGTYWAFIINRFSGSVTIYESDSPAVPENGLQGVIKATFAGFSGPAGGCWNWQTFIGLTTEPGCFVANGGAPRVDELSLENFTLGPPPGFPGPPGQRNFRILKSYNSVGALANQNPSDVSIENLSGLYNVAALGVNLNKAVVEPTTGGGIPTFVLVSYPSAGLVGVWDYSGPALRSTASVPGCDFMESYYDQ